MVRERSSEAAQTSVPDAPASVVDVYVDISKDPITGGVRMSVEPCLSPEESEVRQVLEAVLLTGEAREAYLRGVVPPEFVPWSTVLERWLALGRAGLTVSICYGPGKGGALSFSVDAISDSGQSFENPFAADSFAKAVEIAEAEAVRRGWLAN